MTWLSSNVTVQKNQHVNELSTSRGVDETVLLCQPKSNGYQSRIYVVSFLLLLVLPQRLHTKEEAQFKYVDASRRWHSKAWKNKQKKNPLFPFLIPTTRVLRWNVFSVASRSLETCSHYVMAAFNSPIKPPNMFPFWNDIWTPNLFQVSLFSEAKTLAALSLKNKGREGERIRNAGSFCISLKTVLG